MKSARHIAVLLLLAVMQVNAELTGPAPTFDKPGLSVSEVTLLDLSIDSSTSPEKLIYHLGQASVLENDTDQVSRLKAYIIYNSVSESITRNVRSGKVDPKDPSAAFLIALLEKRNFSLGLTPPSNLQKLLHYIKDGNYRHVWKRICSKGYQYYLLAMGLACASGILVYRYYLKNQKVYGKSNYRTY